jgi:hypothetical protein
VNGRKTHRRIAKVGRATAKPANEHRGVVPKDALIHVPKDAQMHVRKVVPNVVPKHAKGDARQVVPGRRETWDQVADLRPRDEDVPPKGEDLPRKGEAHRPAGENEGAMLKRADKAAARSAAGRWLDRREDSDRPAWARAALVGVDLAGVAQTGVGDVDRADLVRRRWLGKGVQVAALDDQMVFAAPVVAALAIVRGPKERRTGLISGSTS